MAVLLLFVLVNSAGCGGSEGTGGAGTGGAVTGGAGTGGASAGGAGAGGAPCDDGNPCTDDVCDGGTAVHNPTPAGTACSTGGALCDGMGQCVECLSPADCPGQDDTCQTRTCAQGKCGLDFTAALTPLPVQTPGDCKKSVCDGMGGVLVKADNTDKPDDKNPCTGDLCSAGVPSHPPVPQGTACGQSLVCDDAGSCVGCNTPADCPAGDECHAPTCQAGVCGVSFTPANTPVAAQTSHDCLKAVCDGNGNVKKIADDTDLPLDDGNACTAEACSSGAQIHPAKPNGTACNDSNACTQADTCQTGSCAGQNPIVCSALDSCHAAGVCNPLTGACSNPNQPDGVACDDGNACTQADTCQAGACAGQSPNGAFAAPVDQATGTAPYSVAAVDLNGDGKPDLAAANYGTGLLNVHLNTGNGNFGTKIDYPTGASPYGIVAVDMNSDGRPDLAVANNSDNTVSVHLNACLP